ncbi:hypothetical protein BDF20DRAFT_878076 [Mycotypha africana]|uniref:uncharacterized protein n=1 Tax=Mycotypha africana TaxID=64632 RepID=UPI002301BEE9|nr:uncharacterized protein BDF20DRAFT_878076 [Mycotypha africana]KAI8975345.1 hypothetical protein BDF20DRAFT_878076 [Mycotypha africana]
MTRSTRHAAKLEKKKAGTIKMIETLFSFYGERAAEDIFCLYHGQERAAGNRVNMLINGTTKYNKQLRLKKEKDRNKWPKKNTDRMAFCKRKKKKKKKQKVPEERKEADAREVSDALAKKDR